MDQAQGLAALAKSLGKRLLNTATSIFNGRTITRVDEETDFLLTQLEKNSSIVFPYLTESILCELGEIETSNGFRLKDALRRAIHEEDKVGIIAGDEESYVLFKRVFDPLVREIHGINAQPAPNPSFNKDEVSETMSDKDCVLSCRVRVLRSLKGFPFSWFCTREERISVERIVTNALEKLKDDFLGEYVSLRRLKDQNLSELLQNHHIFLKQRCPLNRAWKDGRGIWYDRENSLLILVNEKEHIKIISQRPDHDLYRAFDRLSALLLEMERLLKENGHEFMCNVEYGFLASRPQELGTCLRVSLNVKLPLIAKDPRLEYIMKCLCLQRKKSGIHFTNPGAHRDRIFEVSNVGRIGIGEVNHIQQVIKGVNLLIEMEELLANNKHLDSFISRIVNDTQDMKGSGERTIRNESKSTPVN